MAANVDENDGLRRKKRGVAMNLTYKGVPTSDYDNGRDEKPWQRVPSSLILILLGWYLLLGFLTQLVEDGMPRVIHEVDLAKDNTDTFSEEPAWKYLHSILGNEPRVAGTAYHLNKTVDMKNMVDDIASNANQRVRTDWQIASGDSFMETSASFLNLYVNVSNVIALLEGESGYHSNGTLGASVLVNCHYDSVPFAMGASDNAVFCAVMMEILNKMSKRTRKFKNNIVFLFNGAEEIGLLGSNGFLKHPWAEGVTSVVNLDAAGMNGKPSVFQVTDPRLLNAYKRVVSRPSSQGLGEFLFSSGIIPSDTDFRVFRDFGGIQGIDIAFTKWGHVYHTRYDHVDMLRPGVVQNAGNMLLALLDELADMDELNTKQDSTPAIYYDFLNVFVITYSISAAYGVDIAIIMFASLTIAYYIWLVGPRWSTVQELLFSVLGRIVAMAAGVALAATLASIMIATTIQMRYLSEPWIVVPMFWIPYLVGAVAGSQAYDAWRTKKSGLNRSIRTLQAMTATRLIIMVVLLVLLGIKSLQATRYLFSVPLFIMSMMSLISLTVIRYVKLHAWQHLLLEAVLAAPAGMFLLALALRLDAMVLPVMGRTPAARPDATVAFINVAFAAMVATTVSGLELLFSRRRMWLALAAAATACAVIMLVPFSPFRDDGPSTQRHYWFHSEIVSHDAQHRRAEVTTGVTVLKLDVYSISSMQPLLKHYTSTSTHQCEDYIYCNLPLYRTSYGRHMSEALHIDMPGPAPFSPPASLTGTRSCVGDNCTYNFVMNGGAHNTITLWPRAHANITAWSFSSPVAPSFHQLQRPVYSIIHSHSTYEGTVPAYQFTVTCIIPSAMQSQTALDVSHISHKIHHSQDFTEAYRGLLSLAPKYFNIASFLSFRHNYLF